MVTKHLTLVRPVRLDSTETFHQRHSGPKRLTVIWNALVNFAVPLGYEDGNGFHYGKQTRPSVSMDVNSDGAEL